MGKQGGKERGARGQGLGGGPCWTDGSEEGGTQRREKGGRPGLGVGRGNLGGAWRVNTCSP